MTDFDVTVGSRPTPAPATGAGRFAPGSIIASRYRLVALLGRGGMGEVYRAEDLTLEQPVALKFLPDGVAADAARLAQFHGELRVARQVSHKVGAALGGALMLADLFRALAPYLVGRPPGLRSSTATCGRSAARARWRSSGQDRSLAAFRPRSSSR